MSLEQANAFYQALNADPQLYAKYLSHCSDPQPDFAAGNPAIAQSNCDATLHHHRHWSEADVLRFAVHQGYHFSLSDLYQVWFGQHDYRTAHMEQVGMRLGAIATLNRQWA